MTEREVLKLALEALELAKNSYGKMLLSDPPQDAWKTYRVDDALTKNITAIKEALREHAMYEVQRLGQEIQPEQEPVEWYSVEGETRRYGVGMVECAYAIGRDEVVYVVTHESVKDVAMKHLPTQRTWVGLTDDDKKQIAKEANYNWEMTTGEYAERIGRLTEANLKEKNT